MASAIAKVIVQLPKKAIAVVGAAKAYVSLPYDAPAYLVYEKRNALNQAVAALDRYLEEQDAA
jgi:hypothetical protein